MFESALAEAELQFGLLMPIGFQVLAEAK